MRRGFRRDRSSGLLLPARLAKPRLELYDDYSWSAPGGESPPAGPIEAFGLTSGASDTNATSYVTASITPTANRLVLLSIEMALPADSADPPPPSSITGCGLTWVLVNSRYHWPSGANWFNQALVYRALGASPTTGAITMDWGATTLDTCAWSVVEFSNIDTSGSNGSGAIVQSVAEFGTGTAALATLAAFSAANNATFGATGSGQGASTITATAGSGFAEVHDAGAIFGSIHTEFRNDNDTTVDATLSVSSDGWGVIAIELKRAA